MLKLFLASLLFLTTSLAFAQATPVSPSSDVYLPWPVKAQSGFYGVVDLNQNPPVSLHSTGVALEVFDSTETFLGYTPAAGQQFIFGAYFAANLTVTFQEDVANPSGKPTVHNVILATTDNLGTHVVGHGKLTFDPARNGDAHTINADFNFDVQQFYNFLYEYHTHWNYRFVRLSNVAINACEKYVDFSPPSVTQPCF